MDNRTDKRLADYEKALLNADAMIKNNLMDYINGEYLKKIAFIICYLGADSEMGKTALKNFNDQQQQKIFSYIKNKKRTDSDVMAEAGWILNTVDNTKKINADEILHINAFVPLNTAIDTVDKLLSDNPLLANMIEKNLFIFEDITLISDRDIQKMLRSVSIETLAKALKSSSEEIQEKIIRNMSHRASQLLKEDMEFMGPVKLSDVIKAQEDICTEVKKLIFSGAVIMPHESYEMVD